VINKIVGVLDHKKTSVTVRAERAFLKRLEGGCQVPIAAYARIEHRTQESQKADALLIMDGLVGSIDGKKLVRGHIEGKPEDYESLGVRLAEDLLSRGAKEILAEVYGRYEL
jgi:hydroxymethylbilane synthase